MSRKSKALEFANETYEISVTGRNVQVTDAMKDYAVEKIAKIEKFSDRIINVNVTMDIQKLEHRIDIVIKVNSIKITSHAASTDMYSSVDMALDKIVRRLKRYKTRIADHQAKGVKSIDMKVNVFQPHRGDDVEELNEAIREENLNQLVKSYQPHKVVSQETRPLKTLTLDEAIMEMELSEKTLFLIYRSEEDRKLRVIYRMKDDNYGVIEIES